MAQTLSVDLAGGQHKARRMVAVRTEAQSAQPIPFWPWGYAATGLAATAAVLTAPLAAYVVMIALFGLPHVLCELRYCDERFSARASRAALPLIGVLLAVLVFLRIGNPAGLIPSAVAVPAELGVGVALTAVAVWFMPRRRAIGALVGIAIVLGAVFAPIATFLVFAWLHNLTPLGFISEILPARERRRALLLLALPFLVLPAVIASGLPQAAVQGWLGYSVATAPSAFGAGRYPLSAFLGGGIAFPSALTLFSAAVAAQAMHYFSVIVVMPRLLERHAPSCERGLVPWPSWRSFYVAVGLLALVVFAFHAADYKSARMVYGIAAAIHSWIELPIFLIALGAGFTESRTPRFRSAMRQDWQAGRG